jgi:hypothetical protein
MLNHALGALLAGRAPPAKKRNKKKRQLKIYSFQ